MQRYLFILSVLFNLLIGCILAYSIKKLYLAVLKLLIIQLQDCVSVSVGLVRDRRCVDTSVWNSFWVTGITSAPEKLKCQIPECNGQG